MSGTRTPGRAGGEQTAERLSAWTGARVAPDETDAVRALEQVSGQRPELWTKRSLIVVSHAIERAVLSAPPARPTVVIALFQRMEYFERERAVYERIARTGAMVAVGFCEGPAHELPEGVAAVPLDPGEALVDEWSVVAVAPEAGAFLVATDQHGVEPGATSLEAGRRFRSRWGFARVQATVELARLRLILGARLPADMVTTIDRLLGETMAAGAHPASSSGTPQEFWSSTAALHLTEKLSSARTGSARLRAQLADAHAAAAARHAAGTDQQSGLTTPDFLNRWSDGNGATALPVGLGLFELPAVTAAGRGGQDPKAAYHAARRIASAITQPLGPVDAAVRLSDDEFLVVLPGASELHLARICDEILEQLTLLSDGYPHVALAGRLATTVTRHRPLPLADLRRAVHEVTGDVDPGPRAAGTTAAGDVVVVCATRAVWEDSDADGAAPVDVDVADPLGGAALPDVVDPPYETTGSYPEGPGSLPVRQPRPFPDGRGDGRIDNRIDGRIDGDGPIAFPASAGVPDGGPDGAVPDAGRNGTETRPGADGPVGEGADGWDTRRLDGNGRAGGSAVDDVRNLFGRRRD